MTANAQFTSRSITSAIAAMFLAGLCLTAAAGPAVQVSANSSIVRAA